MSAWLHELTWVVRALLLVGLGIFLLFVFALARAASLGDEQMERWRQERDDDDEF